MQNKYVYSLIKLRQYTNKKEFNKVVKIRLKRLGYKKNPSYRIIAIDSRCKREGAPIEELGFYNPKSKEMKLNVERVKARLAQGAQATETVMYLINNANEDGTLNYKKSEKVKLSKKAQAKKAEEEARAAEEAKAAAEAAAAAAEAPAEETTEA